jgi:hypothetical protein
LREAIRNREVSFPAQVPRFPEQSNAEAQWRLATLYFVRGWTSERLAGRYHLSSSRIRQLLRDWVECATGLGYVQEIPAESAAAEDPAMAYRDSAVAALSAAGLSTAAAPKMNSRIGAIAS